jgi:hypothetical protein
MPEFHLLGEYSATYTPYRTDDGFVAKGVVRVQGKPLQTFEARGRTMVEMAEAAQTKAKEILLLRQSRRPKKKP